MPTAVRSHAKINLGLCVGAVFVLFLTGCDRNDLLRVSGYDRISLQRRNTPQVPERIAISCAESLRKGKLDEVAGQLEPGAVDAGLHDRLVEMMRAFPDREPASVKTVDATKYGEGDAAVTTIVLEYEYARVTTPTGGTAAVIPGSWVFVQSTIRTGLGSTRVAGMRVQASPESIESINAFTFANRGISQYLALFFALLVSAITLCAVVLCVRSKIGRQKWLWLLSMLVNIGNASVNWTTGDWSFNTISIHYGIPPTPANVTLTAYGPWMVVLTVPVGALVFLLCRKRLVSRAAAASPAPALQ